MGDHVQDVKIRLKRVVESRCIHQDYVSPTLLVPESDSKDMTCERFQRMAYSLSVTSARKAYELKSHE